MWIEEEGANATEAGAAARRGGRHASIFDSWRRSGFARVMRLQPTGHPLHTRLQTIDVRRDGAGQVIATASHLDLRKRGFVPVGADLQNSGIIHQMGIRAEIDARQRVLIRAEATMPVVAFEPSELTRGESCRDVSGELPGLAGASLAEGTPQAPGLAKVAGATMGGVRGCSHVLSLGQHLGAALTNALEVADAAGIDWSSGTVRRLFHRSLVFDGSEPEDGTIDIAVQLSDIHFAAAAAVCNPMERFAEQHEIRLAARVDLSRMSLVQLEVAERRRDRAAVGAASLVQASSATSPPVSAAASAWLRRDDAVAELCGVRFLGGFAGEVMRRFATPGRDRPLVDTLLALAPAFLQVCACFSETWPGRVSAADTEVGVGAVPDSCYMWRRDGALHGRKKRTDPNATL